ncbi:hypothetical protein QJS04_geneDACA011842 [Acorus gramineus]|uniref:NADH dehydrogenase [ubiquinone] 1 alpha subcomplex subunit 5 n=1 Tax=Acorus gramineus TaxID=55184 RepID=A0AAV9BIW7_ACOGR|nr:hypothetical protein QJS04_geneDACA011842 [Acorus gramineus]
MHVLQEINRPLQKIHGYYQGDVDSITKRVKKKIFKHKKWDPWDVPEDYECKVIENDRPIPKHVPQHRPGPLPEEF